MTRNPRCSFEMDIPLEMDCIVEKKDVTMRYKSVMGKADIRFLEGEERVWAMDNVIMARHEETKNFEYNKAVVMRTAVAELKVTELTAKMNPVKSSTKILED